MTNVSSKAPVQFRIEVRDKAGRWATDLVGEPYLFGSEEEADDAIETLRVSREYVDAEMRVVRVPAP